jgi:hypothetical protein
MTLGSTLRFSQQEFNHFISGDVLLALSNSKPTPRTPLCPNIRSLDWHELTEHEDEIFPYIHLFLGPYTRCLRFDLGSCDERRVLPVEMARILYM